LVRVPAIKTASAMDFVGMYPFIYAPAHQVHKMGAVVAKLRGTGIPVPVPIVMKPVFAKRPIRCRSKKHIPMHALRYGNMLDVTYISPVAINNGPAHIDVTQFTLMQKLNSLPGHFIAPVLGAHLNHT